MLGVSIAMAIDRALMPRGRRHHCLPVTHADTLADIINNLLTRERR